MENPVLSIYCALRCFNKVWVGLEVRVDLHEDPLILTDLLYHVLISGGCIGQAADPGPQEGKYVNRTKVRSHDEASVQGERQRMTDFFSKNLLVT